MYCCGTIAGKAEVIEASRQWVFGTPSGLSMRSWFGEGTLINGQPLTADIIAPQPSRVALQPTDVFAWPPRKKRGWAVSVKKGQRSDAKIGVTEPVIVCRALTTSTDFNGRPIVRVQFWKARAPRGETSPLVVRLCLKYADLNPDMRIPRAETCVPADRMSHILVEEDTADILDRQNLRKAHP